MTHATPSAPPRLRWTIAATSLGFVLVQLDVTVVNVALARIGAELGMKTTGLQWVVDAYTVTFAALLLSAGALGDRIGSRRAFVSGLLAFLAASLACALAPTPPTLIAARALQGVGAAFLVPCSLALLDHACGLDGAARARAVGLWTAAGGLAMAVGPLVGGVLIQSLGWRSIFLVNLPVGGIGIRLVLRHVAETPIQPGPPLLDPLGQFLAILSLAGLTGATIEAGPHGWDHPAVIAAGALALAAGMGFVLNEARVSSPMLPLALFRRATFTTATLVGFLVNFTFYGFIFVLSLYFQRVRLYSPVETGLAFLPLTALVILSNILGGRMAARIGPRPPMVAGLAIGTVGYGLLRGLGESTAYASLVPGFLLIPIGIGLAVPPMTAALLSSVTGARSGLASGVLNTVRQAGGAMGIAVFGALAAGGPGAAIAGTRTALTVAAGLLLLAAAVAAAGIGAKGACRPSRR